MKLHTDKEYEGSMAVIPRFSSPSSSLFSLDILAKTPPSFPSELSSTAPPGKESPPPLQHPRLYILTNSEKHPPLQLPETLLHNGFCRFLGIFLPRVDLSLVLQFHYSDSQQPTRNQHMALWNCDTWQNRLHENRAPYGGLQYDIFVLEVRVWNNFFYSSCLIHNNLLI